MRYQVVACDYDGTIATHGELLPSTAAALSAVRESGRYVILVTGRQLPDLYRVCSQVSLFHAVVAENGALVHVPHSGETHVLGERPSTRFTSALENFGVPFDVGEVIVATWDPYQDEVLEAIRSLGLELQVIFNKGAVMVLPSGINKSTGLLRALRMLGLSPRNTIGVGDAENDHAMLAVCELAVAVANALPTLKERCDLVLRHEAGAGVEELIHGVLSGQLGSRASKRRRILLGHVHGSPLQLNGVADHLLFAGPSGAGKSTLTSALIEQLVEHGYQFCLLDPEGDYEPFLRTARLGDGERPPSVPEAMEILQDPTENVILNLLGIALHDRPAFLSELAAPLHELFATKGRPHWLIVDEAHHMLPRERSHRTRLATLEIPNVILNTVRPSELAREALATVNIALAIGNEQPRTLSELQSMLELPQLNAATWDSATTEAALWRRGSNTIYPLAPVKPRLEQRRHKRKYASGDLRDHSFYFTGPQKRLNLRAQNLAIFLQMARGVDRETWTYHLQRGDYSHWIRFAIKDTPLADHVEAIEHETILSSEESLERIARAIEARYAV